MIKIVIILVILVAIGSLGYYFVLPYLAPRQENLAVNLVIWGVADDEELMNNVIIGYKKLHPTVNVTYAKQTLENFRTRAQAQISVGQGPDILAVHNTWLPMFLQTQTISAAPKSVITVGDVEKNFYPVVKQTMTQGGNVYALASSVDGLAVYYNKDMLDAQGLVVPTSWPELVNEAIKTTVVTDKNVIRTAGAPFGGYDNYQYWSEVVGLLFLQQPDVVISAPATTSGNEVVSFYNNPAAAASKKIWNPQFTDAVQAFADGSLTFLFAPASLAPDLKRRNPNLHFATTAMPQLPAKTVNFSCFWGYGVSSKSRNQQAAWEFVKFLTDAETEKYIFEQQTQRTGFGLPYSRVDLKNELLANPTLAAFANEAPTFKSFPLCSGTKDNGLNDDMIKAFRAGMETGELGKTQTSIFQILTQFNAGSFAKP